MDTCSKDNTVKLDTARTIQSSWIQQGPYSQVGYSKDYWIHNNFRLVTARITGYTIQTGWRQQGLLDTQYLQVGYSKDYWMKNTIRLDIARITGYTIPSGWIQQGLLDKQ